MAEEGWIPIVLFIVGTLLTAVGALLIWVLKGIRENQVNIWNWAKQEVGALRREIAMQNGHFEQRLTDLNRFIRHSERTIYGEMLQLARQCGPEGRRVAESIEKTLREGS